MIEEHARNVILGLELEKVKDILIVLGANKYTPIKILLI
jgi:hypothetical protein